jgi:hypothetical protein
MAGGAFDSLGIPQGISNSRMMDLADVDAIDAVDGDMLIYDSGRWILIKMPTSTTPEQPGGGGGGGGNTQVVGLPVGGTQGQALVKTSDSNYVTGWRTIDINSAADVPVGGSTGQSLVKTANTDYAVGWQTVAGGNSAADVPTGGTTGQALVKTSSTNYDTGWQTIAAGGTGNMPTGGTTGQALVKTSGTDYAAGWQTIAGTATLQSQIELDAMVGATDDDKLTNAMTLASGQQYPPPILLGPRNYNFSTNRTLYDGFTLIGVQGMGNAELGNQGTMRTKVSVSGSGTWLSASGGIRHASQNWDVAIRNIAFTGSSGKQFMGGGAVIWCMNLRDCSWSGWSSVLGSQSTKLLINLCLFDGWLSFHNCYHGEIHIGGSDNTLFVGMTNIDGNIGYLGPGGSNGQAHLWLDYMEKTTIGPIYSTGEGGWTCIRVTGPAFNAVVGQNGNLGGPIWITGAKLEGRNITDACNGSIIRVEGGELHLRDTWVGYGMKSPSSMGHSPQDAGMIHQTGGQLLVDGCTYDRASGVGEATPFVYSSGGKARVSNIFTGSKGVAWSGKPRVQGTGITVDDTVTVI